MTEKETLQWIKSELGLIIREALAQNPGVIYTEDWLGAMVMRETGILIMRHVPKGIKRPAIDLLMKGDYSQRKNEPSKRYHGFGYWQIDVDSFPSFIASEEWKDPYKCCMKAISVLEGKKKYLAGKLQGSVITANAEQTQQIMDNFHRAVTAAYNTGEGNVWKSLKMERDVDATTFNKDYSKECWMFREIYKSL